ncbi:MAG: C4-dicarboxylate ABC transporter [Verrucomicrobia bacterium]|nr:C4-dicarboxylate ABC transporter [Verrucomicrobiota bacterium]
MDLAWISVGALAVTIVISCTTRLNPGILAIVFAWVIAAFIAPSLGQSLSLKTVLAGFPVELFLTLVGVTFLFAQAQANGTLGWVAHAAVGLCRGNAGLIPIVFFGLTAGVAFVGAGSIAASALVAPMAMAAAARTGISAFLMAVMVGHGAVAGGMSPFAMTGIVANGLMARMELKNLEWQTFSHNFLANALVALAGYFLLGGWRLFDRSAIVPDELKLRTNLRGLASLPPLDRQHKVTLAAVAALIVAVLVFGAHVGLTAFVAAAVLSASRMAEEKAVFQMMPWPVIMMVCGVTLLTSLLERTGGMDRISDVMAQVATPSTAPGVAAFATGIVSVYSSTSGVVLPAFLPMVPKLVDKLGGGDPLAIASSITVGGNLVDVSPLSTIGALCIACAGAQEDRRVLFNMVLAWGLSMSLVGAVLCTLFFGL